MIIGINCRKLFKKWKLYEREAFFGTTVVYEIQWLIKVERYYEYEDKKLMKEKIHNMLWYLFWEYEYYWQEMTARQISELLWCSHQTVDNIIARAKYRVKNFWHIDLY